MTDAPTPDWRNPWPVVGIRPEPPLPSAGLDRLRADGYAVCFDVDPQESDRDRWQDHVENTGIVRMFTEVRTAYTAARLAPDWPRFVRRGGYTPLVREQHVRYDREARMHERFVGGIRVAQRRGKAVVVEQALAEAESGQPVAVAWTVQLLVGPDGRVTEFPDVYWELVAKAEGGPIPEVAGGPLPWGPPA
ncbi:MAG: hypothetical protein FJW95_07435 [Actinobacteria bacterium]|nr:hypothetical protein [Actinomycetota bacterium]